MSESEREMLHVLADAVACGADDIIDCILGRNGNEADLKMFPLSPSQGARLLAAYRSLSQQPKMEAKPQHY